MLEAKIMFLKANMQSIFKFSQLLPKCPFNQSEFTIGPPSHMVISLKSSFIPKQSLFHDLDLLMGKFAHKNISLSGFVWLIPCGVTLLYLAVFPVKQKLALKA